MTTTTKILWAVYVTFLGVLLPHTAWAFRQFEPVISPSILGLITWADLLSYMVAFAFEASIAVLTHKLSKLIDETPRRVKWWERIRFRYVNGIAFGLFVATIVSGMANLAHAVQFGAYMKIFTEWGISQGVYSFAFGGILSLVSLTFANVLSNVTESEEAPNPELTAVNEQVRNLRAQLKESEQGRRAAEQRATIAEERFGAMGDLVKHLFGEDKRQRILTARRQWAALPNSAIAVISESSPAYVSEILSKADVLA